MAGTIVAVFGLVLLQSFALLLVMRLGGAMAGHAERYASQRALITRSGAAIHVT